MKKNLLLAGALLCGLSFFTACSDDDNNEPEMPVLLKGTTAFEDAKLQLNYGESALLGKKVTFTTEDGKQGTLSMEGKFDMGLIGGLMPSKTSVKVAMAPGVVPGELTTSLNVNLTQEGNAYVFEGTDTANGRELKYVGRVDSTSMKLSLKVVMPKNDLLGTWKLASLDMATGKTPVLLSWISTAPGIVIPGLLDKPWPTQDAAKLLATMMLPKLLTQHLQDITYQEDGNVIATYKKKGQETWQTSPVNLAQYYMKDGKLYMQLNLHKLVEVIAANKQTKAPGFDVTMLMQFQTLLSEGVPMNCDVKDGVASVFADKTLILPLLQLLSSPEISGMLMNKVPAAQQPLVKAIFAQLPELIKTTTEFNAGLNLEKVK